MIKANFVSCYEQVGQFSVSTSISKRQEKVHEQLGKSGGNVVTYFCTPEKEVLLYLVGPVSAQEVLQGAEFSDKLNQKLRGLDKVQRGRKIREGHQEVLPLGLKSRFDRWCENQDESDRRTVAQSLNAAVQFVDQLQRETNAGFGFGPRRGTLTKLQMEQNAQRYRLNAELDRNESHVVLAGISPVTIREIQAPVFERLARQKFVERTQRNEDLLVTVQANAKAARPTVLVVTDHHKAIPSDAKKLPKHRDLEERDDFQVVALTKLELVRLMDEANHDPVEHIVGFEARYIVLDVTGQPISTIGQSTDGKFRARHQGRKISPTHDGGGTLLLQALELAKRSE